MSKITLALKYRPQTFDDLVEQESIKKILNYQLNNNQVKNAYLFTGPAGCGKTTTARIFAKCLNSDNKSYFELDGASNNSVDDVRKIIEEAKFKDLTANYKIYIIDECHQLSAGAWAALLKLLEEPPMKTIFILCTTDAQKIPNTILSRVQRFDFKRISFNNVVVRLDYILCKERSLWVEEECKKHIITPEQPNVEDQVFDSCPIKWEKEAVEYIARIADGGMRDAITLLDKCLSYSKQLTIQNVIKALDSVDLITMFDLLEIMYNRDLANLVQLTEQIYMDGVDIKLFSKQFLTFILNTIKYISTNEIKLTNLSQQVKEKIDNVSFNRNFLLAALDMLLKVNELIKWETSPKTLFQAMLISFIQE